MGRTLHFSLRSNPSVKITEANWNKIDKLTNFFNKNFKWTCENLCFSTLDYYPRWRNWFKDSRIPDDDNTARDVINKLYKDLETKGRTKVQVLKELHRRKLIAFHTDNDKLNLQEARGFCKVAGNEWNALLVTVWLAEVSKILPENEFMLHDEGKFLKADIIIKNGKACPNIKKLLESINWYADKVEKGEYVEAYRKHLNDAQAALKEFKDCGWREISHFCRPVNPADFNEHPEFNGVVINMEDGKTNGGGREIMSGFYGEYYGHVSETEAKLRSQQALKNINNLLFQKKEAV